MPLSILYISILASNEALNEAKRQDPSFSSYAVHKFNRLVVEGLVRNGHKVKALSTFYLPNVGVGYFRKRERFNGVNFHYIPTLNYRPIRSLWLVLYSFCYVLFWSLIGRKGKAVMCDVLNVSACVGTVAAASLTGVRCVGIVTDMLGIGVGNESESSTHKKLSLAAQINRLYLSRFSHYVFLTEQMNNVVNIKHCPFIVLEGLVDADMHMPDSLEKDKKLIVIYAGGLYERYGLKLLTEAFLEADVNDSELWLYGNGPFVSELEKYQNRDLRIVYKGIVPNSEVVDAELKASLLVNPRPTDEEFAKYSFPSKNMEYMVSGTPVLTTMLPGMPKEYYPYVYLFDKGESVVGYAEVLKTVLSLPKDDLMAKGAEARQWVLQNKNHIKQTARIIDLIKT